MKLQRDRDTHKQAHFPNSPRKNVFMADIIISIYCSKSDTKR